MDTVVPFALPHADDTAVQLTVLLALQLIEVSVQSVFFPVHVHPHGPSPVTVGVVPFAHKLVVGLFHTVVQFALPHAGDTSAQVVTVLALQLIEVSVQSVFFPVHVQYRGQLPVTVGVAPFAQRLVVGLLDAVVQFALPHAGDTAVQLAVLFALQLVEVSVQSVFFPVQVHPRGPVPVTVGVVPLAHKLVVGLLHTVVPFALPHAEDTAVQPAGTFQVQSVLQYPGFPLLAPSSQVSP